MDRFPGMLGRVGLAFSICAALALAGCGESEKFSDKRIEEAVQVEDGTVGGDPFCAVGEVLNDAEEIEIADTGKDAAILTSKQGNVGIEVVPPFPPDCEQAVRKGLDKLDPEEKD